MELIGKGSNAAFPNQFHGAHLLVLSIALVATVEFGYPRGLSLPAASPIAQASQS